MSTPGLKSGQISDFDWNDEQAVPHLRPTRHHILVCLSSSLPTLTDWIFPNAVDGEFVLQQRRELIRLSSIWTGRTRLLAYRHCWFADSASDSSEGDQEYLWVSRPPRRLSLGRWSPMVAEQPGQSNLSSRVASDFRGSPIELAASEASTSLAVVYGVGTRVMLATVSLRSGLRIQVCV